ncbi:hypothetical protein GQX74_012367 [Glossina fuscipes]|nr:hypothetical protein GQX74_012367 [Glossina fuscipes]
MMVIMSGKLTTAIPKAHCHCLTLGKLSRIAVTVQDVMAILEPIPNTNSIKKKRTENIWGTLHVYTLHPHTLGSNILLHCGFIKYKIPSTEPGKVKARPNNTAIMM